MRGIAIVLLLGLASTDARGDAEPLCLGVSSEVRDLAGHFETQQGGALPPNGAIDARRATFALFPADDESGRPDGNLYPIVATGPSFCFAGGRVIGDYGGNAYHRMPDNGVFLPWDFFAVSAEKPESWNSAGFVFGDDEAAGGTVDGISIWNTWDGVRVLEKDDWLVQSALLSHVHDDCVANDGLRSGRIVDSLLDGCSTGVSVEPIEVGASGEGRTVTIERSLVRLEPMAGPPGSYAPYGHEGFVEIGEAKDLARAPKLVIEDSIFLAEMASDEPEWMGFAPELVESCRNNIMVWLGEGAFPGELPACFTLSRDRAVWDAAVAEWRERHPSLAMAPASVTIGAPTAAPLPASPSAIASAASSFAASPIALEDAPARGGHAVAVTGVKSPIAHAPEPRVARDASALEAAIATHPLQTLFLGIVLGAAVHDRVVAWLRRRKREIAIGFPLADAARASTAR